MSSSPAKGPLQVKISTGKESYRPNEQVIVSLTFLYNTKPVEGLSITLSCQDPEDRSIGQWPGISNKDGLCTINFNVPSAGKEGVYTIRVKTIYKRQKFVFVSPISVVDKPPITVEGVIHLAWGLTLGISHEEAQRKMVDVFADRFKPIWDFHKTNEKGLTYLNEVNTVVSTFLRNMGYERDVLVAELDIEKKLLEEKIKNINELTDMTSLSKEGFLARLIAFLGAGSIPELWKMLQPATGTQAAKEAVSKMNQTLTEAINQTLTPELIQKLTLNINQTLTETAKQAESVTSLSGEIFSFLIAGSIGFTAFTIGIKLRKGKWIEKRISETLKNQQGHWEKHVRPNFIKILEELFLDLSKLVKDHYPKHTEPILGYDEPKRKEFFDKLLPREKLYVYEDFVQCITHKFAREYNEGKVREWIEKKRQDTFLDKAWEMYLKYGCSKSFLKKMNPKLNV